MKHRLSTLLRTLPLAIALLLASILLVSAQDTQRNYRLDTSFNA